MAAVCQPTPISTVYETTTVTSLVPQVSGSTTYVLVDPQAETVATTFRTRNGVLEPVRTTVLGATITTTEALTVTQTSLVVTSVPVSTVLNSCPVGPPTPSTSSSTSSTTSSSTTTSSTTTTTSSTTTVPTSSSTSSSTTTTSSSTASSTLLSSSSLASSQIPSASSASSSTSAPGLLPSNNSNASNSSSSPTNLSAIIGGSVGGGVGAIILLGLLFWCCCGRGRRNGKDQDEWRDPPPFLVGGHAGGSGEFDEKEPMQNRWDPAATSTNAGNNSGGRLSRKYVGAGAGAALAGGVSAYERNQEGGDSQRRKSGKFRPADQQDAYYRNTWSAPPPESIRSEPPLNAGFAGVGAGGGGGIAAASRNPPPVRQNTVGNMMDNATAFDPRARDGGWAVANDERQSGLSSQQAQFQPRNAMPPPAPLPLPGIDYRPNNAQNSSALQSTDAFLVPPSQSRFNRYDSPAHPGAGRQPQTNGYDSPAPSHVSIPALGPYHYGSDSERGGNQLRVTNLGSSTAAGSDWGGNSSTGGGYGSHGGDWNHQAREEIADDNDPYGGLEAGLERRY